MSLFRPRIIPVVLIDGSGQAIKTINFKRRIYLGDPVNLINLFSSFQVDELILLDIDATREKRLISLDILSDIADEGTMPFVVGGGIRDVNDIYKILSLGAEKVVLSDVVFTQPKFLEEASNRFGASTISVCINIKKTLFKGYKIYLPSSKAVIDLSILDAVKFCEESGAGEIIIQSVNEDGIMNGYDRPILTEVSSKSIVPIVALGGAGNIQHMVETFSNTHVSAFASGSTFVFGDKKNRGVIVNYPEKNYLEEMFVGKRKKAIV